MSGNCSLYGFRYECPIHLALLCLGPYVNAPSFFFVFPLIALSFQRIDQLIYVMGYDYLQIRLLIIHKIERIASKLI